MKKICFYCKRVVGCYPRPDCRYCEKECEFRGNHLFDLDYSVEIRFGGICSSCYNGLIRDLD